MKYEIAVAVRYLLMARKRAHTAFLSIISMLGLAVGVATLLISLALLSGLQGKIKERLIAGSPQLLIEPTGAHTIQEPERVLEAIRRISPASIVHTVISGTAWASAPEGRQGRPARIRSFEPANEPPADTAFGKSWSIPSSADAPSIYLRRDFANVVGLFLGDALIVVAPRARLTPFGAVPVWRRYRVTRIVPIGEDERAPEAYLPFDQAVWLFATEGKPTSLEVFMDVDSVEELRAHLERQFPSLLLQTWKDLNRPLFLALRLEKVVMFATISLIIFVAALNLISSIAMLIVEKRPQVGILRTLGASERSVLIIFLAVGLLIGLLGTVLGNVVGLGVAWAANRYELVPLPGEVSYVSHVPFTIEPGDVIGVNLIAVLLSVIATWYPARTASRLDPITAIRI
jgi:lipoprotein-releasing system permease protein